MRSFAMFLMFLVSLVVLANARAAGGQVQVQKNCTVVIPQTFDTDNCEAVSSSPSGRHTFLVCYPEVVVICESEGDPGQIGRDMVWSQAYEPHQINSDPVTGMAGVIDSMNRGYLWSD